MFIRSLILGCALLSAPLLSAGSGTAKLTARSASGRTIFTADLQDIIGIFEGGKLSIDGSVVEFPAAGEDDTGDVIWDPTNGVFTITFSHTTADGTVWFRFWAIPNTFKTLSKDRGSPEGAVYQFEAIIEAKEPRPGRDLITPQIRLSCRLSYRI